MQRRTASTTSIREALRLPRAILNRIDFLPIVPMRCPQIAPPIHRATHPFTSPSIRLSIHRSIFPSIHPPQKFYEFIRSSHNTSFISFHPFVRVFSQSFHLSIHMFHLQIHQSLHLSIRLPTYPSACTFKCMCHCLYSQLTPCIRCSLSPFIDTKRRPTLS